MASLLWNYRRLALLVLAWLTLATLPVAGCKGETTTVAGNPCAGGVIDARGECVAKCDPAQCKEGNVCVDNRCARLCDDHSDCPAESHACTDTVQDDGETPVRACVQTNARRIYDDYGMGTPCPDGYECGLHHCPDGSLCDPFACGGDPSLCTVSGVCNTAAQEPCTYCNCDATQWGPTTYCPNGLQCDFAACGGNPTACVPDPDQCPAADPADPEAEPPPCNIGTCQLGDDNPLTGSPCTAFTCRGEDCTFMSCIGGSVLEMGNANAYCTSDDCASDDDCAPGFYCSARTAPNEICNTMKGNNTVCGETPEACVDPAAANPLYGGTFFEGDHCLQRFSCLKRNDCAPCDSNLDCSLGNADVCYNNQGQLRCAPFCNSDDDCLDDKWCAPYFGVEGAPGTCAAVPTRDCTADTDCGDGDSCVMRSACLPKSGACEPDVIEPPPADKFCHHCLDDEDCKSGSGDWVCLDPQWLYGGFSGMKACYNLDLLDQTGSCLSDSDCPQSPGGAYGECMDGGENLDSSSAIWQTCYFPLTGSRFSCFP